MTREEALIDMGLPPDATTEQIEDYFKDAEVIGTYELQPACSTEEFASAEILPLIFSEGHVLTWAYPPADMPKFLQKVVPS
jgi:hypothetical protein